MQPYQHLDQLIHSDVRWLSHGKFSQKFRSVLPETIQLL